MDQISYLEKNFPICEKGRETEFYGDLLKEGERESGVVLSEEVSKHTASIFNNVHQSSVFREILLGSARQMIRFDAALFEENAGERNKILRFVGDASLMCAGFPRLISKQLRRRMKSPVVYMIWISQSCYRELNEYFWAKRTRQSIWSRLSKDVDNIIQVLWASQANGYPELDELITMSTKYKLRCAKRALKRLKITVSRINPDKFDL